MVLVTQKGDAIVSDVTSIDGSDWSGFAIGRDLKFKEVNRSARAWGQWGWSEVKAAMWVLAV